MVIVTALDIFANYKLLNSISVFTTLRPLTRKNLLELNKIASIWNISQNLSILLFILFLLILLILKEKIPEFIVIYSITWMLYAINNLYDSRLMKMITSYRISVE